jgi:hypothetical protein
MKQIPERFRKRTGLVKAIGVGLGMVIIVWGTPRSADAGPGELSDWF